MARNWKKMSKEEEDKKRQETIDKAIETMNKGIYEYLDSDRFKTLLDTMSKFHDYSMNNTLLILGQNPHATHLAGYNKWQQDFNRQVKRGEKGLMIWMPVEIKVKEKQYVLDEKGNRILGDDGKFKKEEVVVKKHTFKIGYTFDVSQTEQIEGKEVVELSPVKELEGDVKDYQALTKALMEISPVPITIEAFDGTAKGCYNPLTNEIKIQPEMSEVQTIKTMIHEIAHSIVHSNENLDQLKQKENIEFSKSEREVQAESIAYIVSSHLGIDTSDYSFPYVATWGLSTEPSDLENVKQNLKCIKSTSFDLTSKIDTYMEQLQAQQEQNKVNVQIAINWSENGTVAQYSEESNIAPEDKLSLVVKETPLPPSYEVSTSQPHYVEVSLFDVSDDVFYEEDTNDFSPWSDRSINNILRIGSGFVDGKYRIYHLYTAMNVNAKDKATYLKNEYGIGGRTYDFKNKKQDKGYIDHDSKGLTICVSSKDSASLFKDSESKTFSWADVSSRIERLIATGKYFTDEEMEHYNSMNKDEILPAWLLEKCGLSDYTKNSQAVARPDWMEEYEILIDRDNDYVLLRDPDENVNQVWTASGKFLSTVQLENETVAEAMEEYYYNITKGGFYIPDRIKEGYMEEDYDNLSKEDIEL